MALYSSDFMFKDLNKEAEEILGYSKDQVLNKSILEVNALEEFDIDESKLISLLNGQRKSYTILRPAKDGIQDYLAFTASLVTDGPHKQLIGVFHKNAHDLMDLSFVSDEFNNIERILTLNPDLHYIMDIDSKKYVYQNTNILNHFGYTVEDLDGCNELEFLISKIDHSSIRDVALANKRFKTEKNIGEFVEVEYKFLSKHEGWKWLNAKTTPLKQDKETSRVNLSYGIIQDITKSKEIQEKFKAQKVLLDNIAEAIPDIIQVFDLSISENIYSNFKGKTFLGYTETDWVDDALNSLQSDLLHYIHRNIDKIKTLKQNDDFTQELKYRAKTGKANWITIKIKVLNYDNADNPLQVLCIISDVDQQIRDKARLTDSQNTTNAILHSLPDLVLVVSRDGYYQKVVQGADFELTDDKDIVGKHITFFLGDVLGNRILEYLDLCVRTGETQYVECFKRKNPLLEEGYYSNYFTKLNEEEVLVVIRNETAKKHAQMAIDEKVDLLSVQNYQLENFITKNSELERFAYIISHDLKEPLRSINAISELIDLEVKKMGNEKVGDLLDHLSINSSRMISLIEGVLEYSKVNAVVEEVEVDMNVLVQDVLQDLDTAIQEKFIKIEVEELPTIVGDKIQLRQLFLNLIANAIKFNESLSPKVEIGIEDKDGKLAFYVKDNGIGIPEEFKLAVFKMCKRVHNYFTYPGQGLGLSICKKIVDRHGGDIWVEDNQETGTIFYFTLTH